MVIKFWQTGAYTITLHQKLLKVLNSKQILFLLTGVVLFFSSCRNDVFFNPFKPAGNLNTAEIPHYFDWSLTYPIDLNIHLEIIGDTLEPLDGKYLLLLDSSHQIMSRTLVHENQARLFHKINRNAGRMILYFPLTGNYEFVYSTATLGELLFEVGWFDPNKDNKLDYLEITILPPKAGTPQLKNHSETLFGNAEFSVNELGTVSQYGNIRSVDGKWYRTTQSGVPVTIEEYQGNPALKMGQENNSKDVEAGQVIEWSESGLFTASFRVISPTDDAIRMKAFLYFMDQSWMSLRQEMININLNKPSGWQEAEISGMVPDGCRYVLLLFQDYDTRKPFYLDDVTTNHDGDPDRDRDGIPDDEDDYPDDASRAFNYYFPSEAGFSSLAFEDLWPYKGDYDFNDLVVDWRFNHIANASNLVTAIEGVVRVRAIGGSFHNGFGMELPLAQEQVKAVTGLIGAFNLVTLSDNGTEAGQNRAVVILFEDAYEVLRNPGQSFVNTRMSDNYVDPVEIRFEIELAAPVELSTLGTPPYNPFIFVNGTRGREVHLHGHPPTALADLSLLGTGDDYSDPQAGARYYQTTKNLPFGMEVPATFEYPVEKAPIESAYLNFLEWAESGGLTRTDWYQLKSGYRRAENIYSR